MSATNTEDDSSDSSHVTHAIVLKEVKSDEEQMNTDVGEGAVVRPKSQSPTPRIVPEPLHFYSGNPCVEKVKGILHIYKDRLVVGRMEF